MKNLLSALLVGVFVPQIVFAQAGDVTPVTIECKIASASCLPYIESEEVCAPPSIYFLEDADNIQVKFYMKKGTRVAEQAQWLSVVANNFPGFSARNEEDSSLYITKISEDPAVFQGVLVYEEDFAFDLICEGHR